MTEVTRSSGIWWTNIWLYKLAKGRDVYSRTGGRQLSQPPVITNTKAFAINGNPRERVPEEMRVDTFTLKIKKDRERKAKGEEDPEILPATATIPTNPLPISALVTFGPLK